MGGGAGRAEVEAMGWAEGKVEEEGTGLVRCFLGGRVG